MKKKKKKKKGLAVLHFGVLIKMASKFEHIYILQ
jgi:hypothetical protein